MLKGEGDAELHLSVSSAVAVTDEVTLTAGTGLRIAMDSDYSSFGGS